MEAEIAALRAELAALRALCPTGSIVIPPPDWQSGTVDVGRATIDIVSVPKRPKERTWDLRMYSWSQSGGALKDEVQAEAWTALAEALGGVVANHSPEVGNMVEAE